MKKRPMRRCLGCYEMKPKRELIRIVKNKSGEIHVDKTGKANGRGAYICHDLKCLELAIENKRLSNSLKTFIKNDIYSELRKELNGRE